MKTKKRMERVLFWTGPILAGFNVASHILAFFGVGAIASWLIQKWFPFTRWVWVQIFEAFEWPPIGQIEQDALTTLVFFLPLGLWAVLQWEEDERNRDFKTAGQIAGIFFVVIVSQDFFEIVLFNARDILIGVSPWLFAAVALLTVILAFFMAYITRNKWEPISETEVAWDLVYNFDPSPTQGHILTLSVEEKRLEQDKKDAEKRNHEQKISARSKPIMSLQEARILLHEEELSSYVKQTFPQVALQFAVTFFFLILVLCFLLFVGSIGVVTAYCLVLISVLCYAAIAFSPYRLFVTVGVVAAFVLAGLMYDFAIWIIDTISSTEL